MVRWPKPGGELFYLDADYWIYEATMTGEPKRLFPVSQEAISSLHPRSASMLLKVESASYFRLIAETVLHRWPSC